MKPFFSIINNEDSAGIEFFNTKEEALEHQESEHWGEPCGGKIDLDGELKTHYGVFSDGGDGSVSIHLYSTKEEAQKDINEIDPYEYMDFNCGEPFTIQAASTKITYI